MPKETSTTAHANLEDLAESLGYFRNYEPVRQFGATRDGEWWDAEVEGDRLVARLVVTPADGFEVHAFVGAGLVAWSAHLTSSTPAAVLAAAMAVAAEGTR